MSLAAPFLAGLVVLVAVPLGAAVALAFTDFDGIRSPRFTGLANVRRMLDDPALAQALGNTAVYLLVAVPLRLVAALGLALALHRPGVGPGVGRAVTYLPSMVPDVAYALLWLWLLNPLYGPVAAVLGSLHLTSPAWLTDPWAARLAIATMSAFQVGEGFLVALAWRRAIPPSLYEAAAVDGGRRWFAFRRVTLPLMVPVLALLALRDVVFSVQAGFVPALLVTGGGPRKATTYLPVYIYDQAFRYFRLGYAAAVSLTMLVVTVLVILAQYRLARRWRLV